jgi:hypothetical protein
MPERRHTEENLAFELAHPDLYAIDATVDESTVVDEHPTIHLKASDMGAIQQMLGDIAHQERVLSMLRTAMIYEFKKEYGVDLNDDWELDLVERTLKRKSKDSQREKAD